MSSITNVSTTINTYSFSNIKNYISNIASKVSKAVAYILKKLQNFFHTDLTRDLQELNVHAKRELNKKN
ncbi:MAG: hypothetical protein PVI40_01470 [Chlamydiota bacterium]|jgi:hypothetical protein